MRPCCDLVVMVVGVRVIEGIKELRVDVNPWLTRRQAARIMVGMSKL